MDDLITTAEAAAMTRLPVGTLRYFRHCDQGPKSFRLGRRIVYRRQAVIEWIAEQEAADNSRRSA